MRRKFVVQKAGYSSPIGVALNDEWDELVVGGNMASKWLVFRFLQELRVDAEPFSQNKSTNHGKFRLCISGFQAQEWDERTSFLSEAWSLQEVRSLGRLIS